MNSLFVISSLAFNFSPLALTSSSLLCVGERHAQAAHLSRPHPRGYPLAGRWWPEDCVDEREEDARVRRNCDLSVLVQRSKVRARQQSDFCVKHTGAEQTAGKQRGGKVAIMAKQRES
jgi:hypothetical protein